MRKRNKWIQEFENKRILLYGYGKEGASSYRWIRHLFPDMPLTICANEKGRASLQQAKKETVNTTVLLDSQLSFSSYDIVLKSPGLLFPENQNTDNFTSQAELFLKHNKEITIGITGTKGKSTTTSLVHAILSQKYRTHLIGNIGIPCFDILETLEDDDLCAFEISCHQLERNHYSPHVAVFLNLYEEHLDHYGSLQAYGDAKANIFRHQEQDDLLIMNQELPYVAQANHPLLIGKDIRADNHTLYVGNKTIAINECSLIGQHNYVNLAVAYQIGQWYHIPDDLFLKAVKEFQPLHHRLESLGEKDGIVFVNDSISTIGQSTIQAICSLKNVETVLIGGMDRGIDYQELETYLTEQTTANIIFMYETGKRIAEEIRQKKQWKSKRMYLVDDLKTAVSLAKSITKPHTICLLSPAASSYDAFKNFEERGRVFESLVFEKELV